MGGFFEELRRRNVVRVAGVYAVVGWVLLQIATTLEESMGLPGWFDGLIVALLLIGLPIALIFAWAFELTPEGVLRTEDVPERASITNATGRKLDYAIAGGLVVLVALLTWQGLRDEDTITPDEAPVAIQEASDTDSAAETELAPLDKSIAVLPFTNRSPNPDDAFFADGIHDDLLTHLSKISDMQVISRTSVMGYAGSERKIPEIARELGVATVMEGAVQRAGNRVRINVQLIDADTDAHLWAEIYDRELTADNIFDIQSEITKAIAGALNSVLSDTDEVELGNRPTQNLAAYDAYISGRLLASRYFEGEQRFRQSIREFEKAIRLDPQFGEAYAGKAFAEIATHWYTAEAGAWLAAAADSLEKAQELAPEAVETLTSLGYYHYWGHLEYGKADEAFARALAKSPNYVEALAGKAFAARRDGRYDEATALLEKAHRLDPLNVDVTANLAETHAQLGRFADARGIYRRAMALDQEGNVDTSSLSAIWIYQGNIEQAWKTIMSPTSLVGTSTYAFRAEYALWTRDTENIHLTLENWPEDQRRPGGSPEAHALASARALLFLGQDEAAKKLLAEIKTRVDAATEPYPERWKANALYYPVELPGLMGDLEGIREAIADYEATTKPDAWAVTDVHINFARQFVRAGDPGSAFDYIDRAIDGRGPWVYARLAIDTAFDSVRDHPRYQALKSDYENWKKLNNL